MSLLTELFFPLYEVLSVVDALSAAVVFCFGTLLGSFLNVCIGRMPVGKSVVLPGSACTTCGTPIPGWLNVPVVSFLLLGGECRACHTPLAYRYLLLEVLTGLLGVGLFVRCGGLVPELVVGGVLLGILIVVFFMDLDTWLILDEVTLPGLLAGVALRGLVHLPPQVTELVTGGALHLSPWASSMVESSLGAFVGWLLFASISFVGALIARQEALGQGDVKLAAVIGAFLGPVHGLLALLLSFPLGALCVLPLMLRRDRGGRTPVPFGTFMAVAAYLVMLYGDELCRALLP